MNCISFLDLAETVLRSYVIRAKGKTYTLQGRKDISISDLDHLPSDTVPRDADVVYLSLPLSSLNFRLVDLPFREEEKIREVIPYELEGVILGGIETVVFDSVIVGKTETANQILVAYIEKQRLQTILEKLSTFGVDPACVTSLELRHVLGGFAVEKLVSPVLISDEERVALAIEEIKRPTINLRRGEFSYARDIEKRKKSLTVTAALLAAMLLVIAADFGYRFLSLNREEKALRDEIRQSYLELFPDERNIVNELHQTKAHLRALRERQDMFGGTKPLDVLETLSRIERDGARFTEVTIDGEKITVRGEAGSFSGVQNLQAQMLKHFADVTIADSSVSAQAKTLFTITARERGI